MTLSDLSTYDGTMIREEALQGVRGSQQKVRIHWPRQETPTSSQRRLWKRYVTSNFIRYGRHWKQNLGDTRPAFRSRAPEAVNIVPVEHKPQGDNSPKSNSLSHYISSLPQWYRRMLSHFTQEATDVQVWRAFRSRRRITIASDGGLKHQVGTFGWKIVDRFSTTLFSGSGPINGPADIGHSTRSELGGLTAPLLFCVSLSKFWGLAHRCRYTWLTDSRAAISKVTFITQKSYE